MFKKFLIVLLLLCSFVSAKEGQIAVVDTTKESVYLIERNSVGILEMTLVPNSIFLGSPNPNPPTPNPNPPSPVLNPRATLFHNAVNKSLGDPNRADTSVKLSLMYAMIKQKVASNDPAFSTPDLIAVIARNGADSIIGTDINSPVVQAWKPFRDTLASLWIKLAQEGGSLSDFASSDLISPSLLSDAITGLKITNNAIDKDTVDCIKSLLDLAIKNSLKTYTKSSNKSP